jgi:hypothetical protein
VGNGKILLFRTPLNGLKPEDIAPLILISLRRKKWSIFILNKAKYLNIGEVNIERPKPTKKGQ